MPTNLVANIGQTFTSDAVGRIAARLGLEHALVRKSVSAGVPVLLAELYALVSRPGGATKLNYEVDQLQREILPELAHAPGDTAEAALVLSGRDMLTSLLGDAALPDLANAISAFAGLGERASEKVMGLLTPVVLDALGEQGRREGLKPSNLLETQRGPIARALSSGLADHLRAAAIFDCVEALTHGANLDERPPPRVFRAVCGATRATPPPLPAHARRSGAPSAGDWPPPLAAGWADGGRTPEGIPSTQDRREQMSATDFERDWSVSGDWRVYALLGAALVALGLAAGSNLAAAAIASAVVFAALLIAAGALEVLHAFWARSWRGFLPSLLVGLLYLAGGWVLLANPVAASAALTALFAAALIASGVFRVVLAFRLWRRWGWMLLASGAIAIAAALVILSGWPASGLWVLGLCVAIDLVAHGAWWIAYGLDLRRERATAGLA